jgi:two-component system, OmpR family, sensor histidine kinase KdpD
MAMPSSPLATPSSTRLSLWLGLAASVAIVAGGTGISWVALAHHLPDVVMVYLLGVVVVAMRFGYAPSLLAAGLSVAAFDFFFVFPHFSFSVDDKRYVLTFSIMLFVAFVISHLTDRIRHDAAAANERERSTSMLYAMSRAFSVAPSSAEIVDVARRHVSWAFASDVAVLLSAPEGGLRPARTTTATMLELDAPLMARAIEIFARGAALIPGTGYVVSTAERLMPLRTSTGTIGLLLLRPHAPEYFEMPSNVALLEAFVGQTALAIERGRLAEDAQRAQLEIQNERLRNALLSSVSHDLRTPLAVVKGAVTALLEPGDGLPAARRQEYLETISDEASRLNQLVHNLLDMTSLEAGALRARKEWQPLEEVIGVALNRLDEQLGDRPVEVQIAADAVLVPFDATLVEHVLINLVENATKYTPPHTAIEIRARSTNEGVEVEVADHGPGVPRGEEELVFEKFHRAVGTERSAGMGLGLAICRGMVAVHGGRIWCENRTDGGASFRFVLPRDEEVPLMKALPEVVNGP